MPLLIFMVLLVVLYATISVISGLLIVTIWSYVLAVGLGIALTIWVIERSTDG